MKKVILLDAGHGKDTPGKRSPDYSLMEWEYNREIAKRVQKILLSYGHDTRLVVEDDWDMSLKQRYLKVNKICDKYGAGNVIMVSIHCNAAKNGEWANARGWSVWTTKGQTNSDKLADELFAAAQSYLPPHGMTLRKETYNDGDVDYEKNFTVIYGSKCPAVLTENLFMDNKIDCAWLLTEEGKETITNIHVDGILKYMEKYW
jgi:N-acetylmuramoyl-L-alanine amidase